MLPDWKNYSNRKNSLLASSSSFYSGIFSRHDGNALYVVIPTNGSKLCICPGDDFNRGEFDKRNENFKHFSYVFHPSKFENDTIPMTPNRLFYAVGDFLNGNYISFKNEYNNLIGSEEIDSDMYNEVHKMYELDNIRSAWLHDKDKYNEPIDMLLDGMNPDKNGFKIIKYNGDNRAFQ